MAIPTRDLEKTLRRVFRVSSFRPGQEDVVRSVLSRRDTVAIMPTGSGKSLCYQLPGLHLHGTTVVISPLISLMKDQTDKLSELGLDASQLNSALTPREETASLDAIRSRDSEFVLTTPERLASDPDFVSALRRNPIDFIVVDEAHCVSQWGNDFRPAYLALKPVIDRLGHPPIVALTATATGSVVDDIVKALGLRSPHIVNTGIFRSNLKLEVLRTASEDDKRLRLVELLRDLDGTGIVYAATITQVDTICTELNAVDFEVAPYTGRLGRRERQDNQERFMSGDVKAIVATNAFGMGIDKADIRFVIHYAIPGSPESYYQEAGRAGRDGSEARCILLFRLEDRRIQRYFIAGRHRGARTRLSRKGLSAAQLDAKLREEEARRQGDEDKLERMMLYAQSPECRWKFLLQHFGDGGDFTEFACGACDNCLHPPESQIAPPRNGLPSVNA